VGYDAYVVIGTAPKKITTKDESLMECPFPLEMDDSDEDQDPNIDNDAHLMTEEKKDKVKAVDDFKVE